MVAMLGCRFNLCSLCVCSELFHMGFCCSKEICFTVLHVFLTAVLIGHESNDLLIVFKLTNLRIKSKKRPSYKSCSVQFLLSCSLHTVMCDNNNLHGISQMFYLTEPQLSLCGIQIQCPDFDRQRKCLHQVNIPRYPYNPSGHSGCCQQVTAERDGFPLQETSQRASATVIAWYARLHLL